MTTSSTSPPTSLLAPIARVSAITRQTLLQISRTKMLLFPVVLALGMLLLLFVNTQRGHYDAEEISIITQTSAELISFFGTLLIIVIGSASIASEVESGTMQLLVVRPISRQGIVLGKLLGLWIFAAGCYTLWGLEAAMIAFAKLGSASFWPMFGMISLSVLPALLFGAIAITMSSRGGRNATVILSAALWFCGAQAHRITQLDIPNNYQWVQDVSSIVERVIPNSFLGGLRTAIVQDTSILSNHLFAIAAIAGWALLAVISFRVRRNISG